MAHHETTLTRPAATAAQADTALEQMFGYYTRDEVNVSRAGIAAANPVIVGSANRAPVSELDAVVCA